MNKAKLIFFSGNGVWFSELVLKWILFNTHMSNNSKSVCLRIRDFFHFLKSFAWEDNCYFHKTTFYIPKCRYYIYLSTQDCFTKTHFIVIYVKSFP